MAADLRRCFADFIGVTCHSVSISIAMQSRSQRLRKLAGNSESHELDTNSKMKAMKKPGVSPALKRLRSAVVDYVAFV